MGLKKLILRVFNILICGIGILFLFTGALLAYNLEEYYPLDEGNTWTYLLKSNENGVETTDREINKIKGTEKIGEVETKKVISLKIDNRCIAIDSEGVKLYKQWGWVGGEYEIYEPPKMFFPNIEIGESKAYPINNAAYTINDVIAEGTREVGTLTIALDSVEDVEVPAGKFKDCLKFISVYEYKNVNKPEGGKETLSTWLAPGIGKVKSYVDVNEYNLDTNKEYKLTELLELTEASVNGNKLPLVQETSAPEIPLQTEENQSQ